MNDLISIIVPIYKVEKYLEKCIDSILLQSYKNIEVILVDDGSPDNCSKICDAYKIKDNRIKVIHKKNGGLSDARNIGIIAAKGKYMMFIDGDDFIAPNTCEILIKKMLEFQTDLVICNFFWFYSNENYIKNKSELVSEKIYTGDEALTFYVKKGLTELIVAWNKLYKRDLFVKYNLTYAIGRLHEDEFFCKYLFYYIKNFVYIDQSLYYYRQRHDSIMGKKSINSYNDTTDYIIELFDFIKLNCPNLTIWAWKKMVDKMYEFFEIEEARNINIDNCINKLQQKIILNKPDEKWKDKLGKKYIIKYWIARFHMTRILNTILNRLKNERV